MAVKKAAPEIDPEQKYKIFISKSFEHDGVNYVPRHGTNYKVLGSTLIEILSNVDTYEAA